MHVRFCLRCSALTAHSHQRAVHINAHLLKRELHLSVSPCVFFQSFITFYPYLAYSPAEQSQHCLIIIHYSAITLCPRAAIFPTDITGSPWSIPSLGSKASKMVHARFTASTGLERLRHPGIHALCISGGFRREVHIIFVRMKEEEAMQLAKKKGLSHFIHCGGDGMQ